MTGERTEEGLFVIRKGLETAIARALAYAPYADLVWCETSTPDIEDARKFAEAVLAHYPNKILAYNCSPSFNWRKHLSENAVAKFQNELGAMGYKFQFVTLAGFHALNLSMFDLARGYKQLGMAAYSRLQEKEFGRERDFGYEAVKYQRFAGTGYFDACSRQSSVAWLRRLLCGDTRKPSSSPMRVRPPSPRQVPPRLRRRTEKLTVMAMVMRSPCL